MVTNPRTRFNRRAQFVQERLTPEPTTKARKQETEETTTATTTAVQAPTELSPQQTALINARDDTIASANQAITSERQYLQQLKDTLAKVRSGQLTIQQAGYRSVGRLEYNIRNTAQNIRHIEQSRDKRLNRIEADLKQANKVAATGLSAADLKRQETIDRQNRAADNARKRALNEGLTTRQTPGLPTSKAERLAAAEVSQARATGKPVPQASAAVLAAREERLARDYAEGRAGTAVIDPEAARQAERERFLRENSASLGVSQTGQGLQLVVLPGAKPATAGEYFTRLKPLPFSPARLTLTGERVGGATQETLNAARREQLNQQVRDYAASRRRPVLENPQLVSTNNLSTPSTLGVKNITEGINDTRRSQRSVSPGTNVLGVRVLPLSVSQDLLPSTSGEERKNTRLDVFEKEVELLESRERAFYQSSLAKGIEKGASYLTFGKGRPIEDRSFLGQTAEILVKSTALLPASLYFGVGKVSHAVEAATIKETRPGLKKDLLEAPKKVEAGPYSFLPGGTPINPEGAATLITAFGGGALGYSRAKTNPVNRAVLPRLYPEKFTTTEATGLAFVEDYTVPKTVPQLRTYEGQRQPTTHVTVGDLPQEAGTVRFTTVARPESAGALRQRYELYNFYKGSPTGELANVQRLSPSGEFVDVPKTRYSQLPFRVPEKPQAYLGYSGILKADSQAPLSGKVIYGNPTVKILQFNDAITPTPKSLTGLRQINRYQIQQSGKTFVPAENIAGKSVEGQFISPSRYVDAQGKPLKGYEDINTPGSVIEQTAPSKFFYYKSSAGRYYKFELIPAETKPATLADTTPVMKPKALDVGEYNKAYGRVEIRQPSPVPKSVVPQRLSSPITKNEYSSPSLSSASKPFSESFSSTSSRPLSSAGRRIYSAPSFVSPSRTPSNIPSLSPVPSPSPSPSPSPRPSLSPSPSSRPSLNPSMSPQPSPSPSPSPRPSLSPSPSPSLSLSPTPSELLVRERPRIPKPKLDLDRSPSVEGFRAFAKVKGQFVPVSGVLSEKHALFAGASFVGKSSAATFELRPSGTVRPLAADASAEDTDKLLSRFRLSQQGKSHGASSVGVSDYARRFVERNRFRIDTPGELREITYKGLLARRRG